MCLHTLHQKLSLQEHFFCWPLESNVSAHSNSNSLTFLTLNNYFLTFNRGYFLSSAILCTLPCGNDGGWNLAVSWLGTWVQLLLIISMCSIPTHLYMEYSTYLTFITVSSDMLELYCQRSSVLLQSTAAPCLLWATLKERE